MTDLGDVLLRLAIDVGAAGALVYGVFLPRDRRMDLVVVYALFNVGVFLALVVIADGQVSMGVGFGLFAVLSIIRLRSEPFSNRELAYFFVALVIALVCAIDLGSPVYAAVLATLALAAAWAIDHPRLSRPTRRLEVMLELAFSDQEALRRHLEERLKRTRRRRGGARARLRAGDDARRGPLSRRAPYPTDHGGDARCQPRRPGSLTRSRRSASPSSTRPPPCATASTPNT
jgi:Domain of unknown function (DUF4956)